MKQTQIVPGLKRIGVLFQKFFPQTNGGVDLSLLLMRHCLGKQLPVDHRNAPGGQFIKLTWCLRAS